MIWNIIYLKILYLLIKTICVQSNSVCGLSQLNKSEVDTFISNLTVKSQIIFIGQIIDKNCSLETNICLFNFNISYIFKQYKKLSLNDSISISSSIKFPGCSLIYPSRKILIFVQYISIGVLKLNYAITRYSKKLLKVVEDYSCRICSRQLKIKLPVLFNVTEGDYVIISCRGIGKPYFRLRWFKDYLPIILKKHFNGKISSLEFKSVKSSDSGIYQCQAFNHFQSSDIYNSTLIVRKKIPTDKIKRRCKDNNFCFSNGTCYIYSTQNKKFCSCISGYSGYRCQYSQFNPRDLEVKSSEYTGVKSINLNSGKILLVFLVLLFCILFIMLIILICLVIRERKSLNKLKILNKQKEFLLVKEMEQNNKIANSQNLIAKTINYLNNEFDEENVIVNNNN